MLLVLSKINVNESSVTGLVRGRIQELREKDHLQLNGESDIEQGLRAVGFTFLKMSGRLSVLCPWAT